MIEIMVGEKKGFRCKIKDSNMILRNRDYFTKDKDKEINFKVSGNTCLVMSEHITMPCQMHRGVLCVSNATEMEKNALNFLINFR